MSRIRNAHISRLPYAPEILGRVEVDCPDELVAGSMASIRVTYTAGKFGIDDQGSIRILFRFASDSGRPQFERPNAPNFVTLSASNGTTLIPEYHPRGGFRPWFKAIRINVMKHFLAEGDSITLILGDKSQGSAGWRVQSLREPTFEVRVQADPFGAVVYGDVAGGKQIGIVPGEPALWKLVLPTQVGVGEPFRLSIRAEDRCGNPTTHTQGRFRLVPSSAITGLPEWIDASPASHPMVFEGLSAPAAGVLRITLVDEQGRTRAVSNPLRAVADSPQRHYWGDFHAQSEETIGTNTARDYFLFARDRAFSDFVGHQGNDFQITTEFWNTLKGLYREFNAPGRFITLPGYEYSPVTALGGDRNIYFFDEDRPIRRSSHALVEDVSDIDSDCNHVNELFQALRDAGENALAFAHVGGRYADLRAGHDGTIEKSVEVHSSWGTFEWILFDAFELGHRVGVVCNSDDHKGRPGASHPGASMFGAYGGLTCIIANELSRAAIWDCLKRRRHYGTTGERLILEVRANFATAAERFEDDPKLGPTTSAAVSAAMMGDIVRTPAECARISVSAAASSPIERVDLRCGEKTVEIFRPYAKADLGRRIRVIWEGAEYRGRGRMSAWDGHLEFSGNAIESFEAINFWHLEKELRRTGASRLEWESVTTGNFAGADILLQAADAGTLSIATPHVQTALAVRDIGYEDTVFEAGGLGRRIRVFRLPDANPHLACGFEREIALAAQGDTPVYVRVTLENGHQAWSSPIYLFH